MPPKKRARYYYLGVFIVAVIGLASVLLIYWRTNTVTWEWTDSDGKKVKVTYDTTACRLSGWQEQIGLSYSLTALKNYQGVFGLSTQEQSKLEDIQTDFALEFEALCKDRASGVYQGKDRLYDCRRNNVNHALESLRQLRLVLSAVNTNGGAQAQRDAVDRLIDGYFRAVKDGFSDGCTAAHLELDRNEMAFSETDTEKSLDVTNAGEETVTWWVQDTPAGFLCQPSGSDQLSPKAHHPLIVYRLAGRLEGTSFAFHVMDDWKEEQAIAIKFKNAKAAAANPYGPWERTLAVTLAENMSPERQQKASFDFVSGKVPEAAPSVRYLLTTNLLQELGYRQAAVLNLEVAARREPGIEDSPSFELEAQGLQFPSAGRTEAKSRASEAELAPAAEAAPANLPKTGGYLPVIGLFGALTLALGLGLRAIRRAAAKRSAAADS
jgi:hypothetical protein